MKTLHKIRDIYRSIADYEQRFEKTYNLCLNEGMLLCSLFDSKPLSSGEVAELLQLTASNTSKIIKSIENKGLIKRMLGNKDKRQMYFSLTAKGKEQLQAIDCSSIGIPVLLKKLIDI